MAAAGRLNIETATLLSGKQRKTSFFLVQVFRVRKKAGTVDFELTIKKNVIL